MNEVKYYGGRNRIFTFDPDQASNAVAETDYDLPLKCRDDLHTSRRCVERHGSRRKARTANCIDLYRYEEELSFRQLAEILGGISWQRAQSLCNAGIASPKAVTALA